MKQHGLLVLAFLFTGCATAPTLERQCFESLTAEYLAAQDELLELDATWRAASQRLTDGGGQVESHAVWQRIQDARVRRASVLFWYERLYDRLRLRAEEEEILAETRLMLFTGPAALFYPVVRWNLHEVLWDGTDPDAESDPVTRYCTDRLASASAQGEVEAKVEHEAGPVQSP